MMRSYTLAAVLCVPLSLLTFTQGSSCRSSKTSANSNNNNQNQGSQAQSSPIRVKAETEMKGQWGGPGIALEVSDTGARLEFDCAHGTITEKIAPNASGKFEVNGLYTQERPGPTREDESAEGQPAIYAGSIDGETLTLTITLSKSKEKVGPYNLSKGKTGRIRKCA